MIRAHSFHKAMAQVHKQMGAQQPQRVTQMSTHEPELTPWFSGRIKPARRGVYLRSYGTDFLHYCLFDGKEWFAPMNNPQRAASVNWTSNSQVLPWRGLKEEAK